MIRFPSLRPLKEILDKLNRISNKFELYRTLKELDPELYGAIDRIAKMVRYSYQGVFVHVGRELSETEQELQRIAREFAEEHDLKSKFYTVADYLLTYGNYVAVTKFQKGAGLVAYQTLPIEHLTIVEKKEQIGDPTAQVFESNIYVLNETSMDKQKTWPADQILHIALNREGSVFHDITGRYTFGVWGTSPIEPLKVKLLWKLSTIYNDILIRQRLIPREHHKLDLRAFDPRYFPGTTMQEKYNNARKAALDFINEYKTNIAKITEPDRSYITSKDVEIEFVEPKKVTYVSPNELIEQIDLSIFSVIGPVETAVTGRSRRTYATELIVASYAVLVAETLADIIKAEFLKLIKRHIRLKYGSRFSEEDLNKIDIKVRLTLDVLRGEIIRQVAVLAQLGLCTTDELRAMIGLEPLTEDQIPHVVTKTGRAGQYVQTPADVTRDVTKRVKPIPQPLTPESRRERQVT